MAKPHARNKRQGGKTLTSEISVISGFGGSETPPQSPAKKNDKTKNFEKLMREKKRQGGKNSCEKKKARGQNLMRKKKGKGAKI